MSHSPKDMQQTHLHSLQMSHQARGSPSMQISSTQAPSQPIHQRSLQNTTSYHKEIQSLQTHFGASCVNVVNESEIQVFIKPADPATFPWSMHALILHFTIPSNAQQVPEIEIMNVEFPQELKESIRQRIKNYCSNNVLPHGIPTTVFQSCLWAHENLESLMVNQQVTKKYHSSIPPVTSKYASFGEPIGNPDTADEDEEFPNNNSFPALPTLNLIFNSEDTEDNETETENEEEAKPVVQAQAQAGTQAIHVICKGLGLINVGVLRCYQMKATISCRRCKSHVDVGIGENQSYTSVCEKCHNPYYLFWQPEIMHVNNNSLGHLHTTDVILFDLLPSCFNISCLNCGKEMLDRKMSFSDHTWQKNCESCHKLSSVKIESIDIKKVITTGRMNGNNTHTITPKICNLDDIYAKKGKKKTRHQDEGIFSGSALPNNGACKHYKKSHRWLRFPCCHKVYPCNRCHDLSADHVASWANKMICGYCSTEQPFSEDFCCKCGVVLTTMGQSSTHWNGGEGCRDQSKMSKKDNKKYRGLNKTTPSTYDPIWSNSTNPAVSPYNKR
eukprot:TRINITY_DN5436_c0_g1_i1.p1 TRINITY_DN5436_c0_g1~~TRINITY_DN5436_c0_g1_i1.p1  ORF type:complete len:557 (+),score=57.62 TRINITY_DN5436_c0_g1_i1:226-1896(+)